MTCEPQIVSTPPKGQEDTTMTLQDNAFHSAISIVWNFTILFIRLTIRDTSAEQNKAHQSLFHEGA